MERARPAGVTAALVHVFAPGGHYLGQLRRVGCRNWQTITGRCSTRESAIARAARRARGREWKRLRVLFVCDNPYYGPTIVFEGKK